MRAAPSPVFERGCPHPSHVHVSVQLDVCVVGAAGSGGLGAAGTVGIHPSHQGWI